jgi:hypothetical protein
MDGILPRSTKEQISPNAPEARGAEIDLKMYVDSDHAGDQTNRRSRTGYISYVNKAPVIWHCYDPRY